MAEREIARAVDRAFMKSVEIVEGPMAEAKMGRVAFRGVEVDGIEWWTAFFARHDTMEGAVELGRIRLRDVEAYPAVKQLFMSAMQEVLAAHIKQVTGRAPDYWLPPEKPPKEH